MEETIMAATVSPDALLRQLAGTWAGLEKEGPGVLRACSMTLVTVAQEAEDLSSTLETLASLMPEHPARSIVVRLQRGAPLAGNVTAQCWMPFGQERQICSEQIEITASPDAIEDAASLIVPLAAPDLPVILWCRSQGVVESAGFERLAEMAGKVVLDTADWPDAHAAIQRIAALAARGLRVADLSWTRLTRWREMLSQVFENRRQAARLPAISRVRVIYGGTARPVAALYMGAWLVDALAAAGARPELNLEPDANIPAGHFSTVELSGAGFHVELARQQERLVTTVDGLSHCAGLPQATDCRLLREELGIVRQDAIFERTLSSAARL
jgi:glucose-6-phosphate dehydrogenase assembly protein OpcA